MCLMIEACAQAGVAVVILDRPNPLGGQRVEGPSIEQGYGSFIGLHSIPVRHGLTPGEIARLYVAEKGLKPSLQIIAMEQWRREFYFEQTQLPWVLPSPNMPTPETAMVDPGACLFEGTNLSEGRGTTRPFELLGAPFVDPWDLVRALETHALPGVTFRPTYFRPTFHKWSQQKCGGVQLHVYDRQRFEPLKTGVALLLSIYRLYPREFAWREQPYEFVTDRPAIDLLAGGPWLRQGLEQGADLASLCAFWPEQQQDFLHRRRSFLLYEEP
jgi:uncharacterized protein YbbC (DUF1343 family)